MLDIEHFQPRESEIALGQPAFSLYLNLDRLLRKKFQQAPANAGVVNIYFRALSKKTGDRYYIASKAREKTTINGFIDPAPLPRKPSVQQLLRDSEDILMLSLEIGFNGILSSEGVRISPLDKRITLTASDINEENFIEEEDYIKGLRSLNSKTNP
jgi:hypothetical protein